MLTRHVVWSDSGGDDAILECVVRVFWQRPSSLDPALGVHHIFVDANGGALDRVAKVLRGAQKAREGKQDDERH